MELGQFIRRNIYTIIFIIILVITSVFYLWRNLYGIALNDESFYLTLPYRYIQGDALFKSEWHVAQMHGFILIPFVKAYMLLFGTTDGIILFFRHLYIVCHIVTSCVIYFGLRRISKLGALLSSIVYFAYIPFGIPTLSYNTIAIGTLIVSMVLLLNNDKYKPWVNILVGILFSLSVLCCPYLVVLYALYLIVTIINSVRKKKSGNELYTFKTAFFITLGISIVLIVFVIYVLGRSSISDIIRAFPFIINDPSHDTTIPIYVKCLDYFKYILLAVDYKMLPLYIVFVLEVIVTIIDKKRYEHKKAYVIIALVISAVGVLICALTGFVNMILFPAEIVVIESIILTRDSGTKKMVLQFYIPAIIYTFLLNMSSNQEYVAISSSSIVALVIGIVIVISEAEKCDKNVAIKVSEIVFFAIILVLCIGFRFYSVVGDTNFFDQNYKITKGPEKGIIGSEEKSKVYEDTYDLIKKFKEESNAESAVLMFTEWEWTQKTTYYLMDELKNSCCSAWMLYGDKEDIMKNYYSINPNKIPDMIYVELAGEQDYLSWLREEIPYRLVYSDVNGKEIFVREGL